MVTDAEVNTKIEEIRRDLSDYDVVLYMKGDKDIPMCGFSAQVVNILKFLQVDFETRDVLKDPILRQAIKVHANWPTLPQLYIQGTFIGGCDIVTELYNSGELKEMLP
ncbi:MAG: Grx4 family monothiol glutaredoxin [Ardenticatenaceae bacterium]|nr:Grx4 family monothiol glutaredoxin [Ardenticatenaceae bacterium]